MGGGAAPCSSPGAPQSSPEASQGGDWAPPEDGPEAEKGSSGPGSPGPDSLENGSSENGSSENGSSEDGSSEGESSEGESSDEGSEGASVMAVKNVGGRAELEEERTGVLSFAGDRSPGRSCRGRTAFGRPRRRNGRTGREAPRPAQVPIVKM